MATATKAAPAKKAPAANGQVQQDSYPVEIIDLKDIDSNSYQSRGMGALANLIMLGYGLFEKIEADKNPLWPQLMSDKAEERNQAVALVAENEPTVIEAATSQAEHGQLQPIGVVKQKDGKYNVIYGMQRCIARAYNWATDPSKHARTVEAKILPESAAKDNLAMRMRSRAENRVRKEESPIDIALFYKELKTEFKLDESQIAEREDCDKQTVKNYLDLLHPKLKDKQVAIHSGELKIDPALKLLRRRKEGNESTEKTTDKQRMRFPSVKTIQTAYTTGKKPKKMDDDLWVMYKDETVRKFIAASLGFKYLPYKEPKAEAKTEEANGKKGKKTFVLKRSQADKLLLCLGLTNAKTWDEKAVITKLESITSIAEEGQTVEDKGAQSLLDKLLAAYPEGYSIKIAPK